MKKIITSMCAAMLCSSAAFAQAVIDGKTYTVDTICQRQEGPGIVYTQVRLADYPLNAYVLEMDLNNKYNRIETTHAYNTLGKQETLANAYTRHKAEGKKPIAACNANFWVVNGHGEPWISFMLGTPFGAVVYNDTTFVNTNTSSDTWNGGPNRTGSAAIDHDKTLYLGRSKWSGTASSSKFSKNLSIIQVNKRCKAGELALFSKPYGRTRTLNAEDGSNFVFVNFKEGSSWAVNKNMTFVVADVKLNTNGLTLGDYDAVLVGQGDTYNPELAKLTAGDEITIKQGWKTIDGDKVSPWIENMVEGNATIMKDGELTDRNYDETYNSQTYSRCAYGADKTGKKLYMMVIDMSTNEYGRSAGCSTAVMCQLWKFMCPELWTAVNFDAGGSAQMMLNGSVINRTTEGNPRAVACGWMLYSSAPGDDKTIASIKFENPHLKMPVLSSFAPKVIGYNQYGEVVDRDVKVTYDVDANIGSFDGSAIVANATPGIGKVTAKFGDNIIVTAPMVTEAAQMAIRIKPQILLDSREYPVEVVSQIGRDQFNYNPTHLTWTNSNPDVISIENGIIKALKEGESTISCELNGFTDQTTVKVEIAKSPMMNVDWTDWTLKSTGAKDMVLSSDGKLTMTYNGGRGAYISLSKDETFYSIPDKIYLDFTSTVPMQYLQVDFRSNTMDATNFLTFGKDEGGFEAGQRYKIELPINELGDPSDLALYPIHVNQIRFTPRTSGFTKGENSITFHGLYGEYSHSEGAEEIKAAEVNGIKVYPNPVTDGTFTVCAAGAETATVSIYNQAGTLLQNTDLTVNGGSATVDTGLAAGIYFVKVTTASATSVQKLIVK